MDNYHVSLKELSETDVGYILNNETVKFGPFQADFREAATGTRMSMTTWKITRLPLVLKLPTYLIRLPYLPNRRQSSRSKHREGIKRCSTRTAKYIICIKMVQI
jgi:hypothetical protein